MPKASELINRSNTICHYKRFSGFSEPNCNGCNDGYSKMVELLHLFPESRLTAEHPCSDATTLLSDFFMTRISHNSTQWIAEDSRRLLERYLVLGEICRGLARGRAYGRSLARGLPGGAPVRSY